jgi:hypothetical protein
MKTELNNTLYGWLQVNSKATSGLFYYYIMNDAWYDTEIKKYATKEGIWEAFTKDNPKFARV